MGDFDYPPRRHVLRDLGFETEDLDGGRARAHLTAEVATADAAGELLLGPLLTVVDLLGGALAARVVAPDWVATSGLTFHREGVARVGDDVTAEAWVLRSGANTVVVEVDVAISTGPVGECLLTFVRLPRRESTPDLSAIEPRVGERSGFALEDSGFSTTFADALGLPAADVVGDLAGDADAERVPGGSARGATGHPIVVELTDYVRNSFGAMNGGVVASLVEAAADAAFPGARVDDLVLHYVGQGRTGPVRATSRLLRDHPEGGSAVRVEVEDVGADRLMAVAHVTLRSRTPVR